MGLLEKHIFSGNHTSMGFYSYLHSILNSIDLNKLYIIKGASGVDQSNFIHKFGIAMIDKGYFVEYIHNPIDDKYIDGVIIPQLCIGLIKEMKRFPKNKLTKVNMVEIINLNCNRSSKEIQKNRIYIHQIKTDLADTYTSAYRFLNCAQTISEEINSIYNRFTDQNEFLSIKNYMMNKLFTEVSPVKEENLSHCITSSFLEAYTGNGFRNYIECLNVGKRVWVLYGDNIDLISRLLKDIAEFTLLRGCPVKGYYSALSPNKLQHLFIPKYNLLIKSMDNLDDNVYEEVIDLYRLIDFKELIKCNCELINNKYLYELLIQYALEKLTIIKDLTKLLDENQYYKCDCHQISQQIDSIVSKY